MCILTIGAIATDVVMRVARLAGADEEVPIAGETVYEGGSAANTAVGISRLGVSARFLGCVGADGEAEHHLRVLRDEGVDTSFVLVSETGRPTSRVMVFVDASGARQMYFRGGASEELTPEAVTPAVLEGVSCVHLCTLGPEFAERVVDVRRERGLPLTISLDPGCVGLEGPRARRVRALLPEVDVLFVNAVECARLFEGLAPEQVVSLPRAALPRHLVIKCGAVGARILRETGPLTHHRGVAVDAVDSTGAGDAFAAAYLAGLHRGLSADEIGRLANVVAAQVTQQFGCRAGLPTWDRATALLRLEGGRPC